MICLSTYYFSRAALDYGFASRSTAKVWARDELAALTVSNCSPSRAELLTADAEEHMS